MSPEHFIEIRMTKPKYIFVTGGVTSSLGKGIISASLAKLLQAQGYNPAIQKLDPYINAPQMPYGYLTTLFICLIPPLWYRVIEVPLKEWEIKYSS